MWFMKLLLFKSSFKAKYHSLYIWELKFYIFNNFIILPTIGKWSMGLNNIHHSNDVAIYSDIRIFHHMNYWIFILFIFPFHMKLFLFLFLFHVYSGGRNNRYPVKKWSNLKYIEDEKINSNNKFRLDISFLYYSRLLKNCCICIIQLESI